MLTSILSYYYLLGGDLLFYFVMVLWYLVKAEIMIPVAIKLINNTGIIEFLSKNHTDKQFIQ